MDSEPQPDNVQKIDEIDLDQAFIQVIDHFCKTNDATEIVQTFLDDPDTLYKCFDMVKMGPIMVCTSCLHIFTTVRPYIDHYPQCTKPPSSKVQKQIDRATISELALLLWRNAVVSQIAKLPTGAKFMQQENQLHHGLNMLWNECSTHQMLHCHELFNRVAVHVLTRKPILPAVEKLCNDPDNEKKKANKVFARRATADKLTIIKIYSTNTREGVHPKFGADQVDGVGISLQNNGPPNGPIMLCTSCLTLFHVLEPYIDHYPNCTEPPSFNVRKQMDGKGVIKLAMLLWRNSFVTQFSDLITGLNLHDEVQMLQELDSFWMDCNTRYMVHCHKLFNRIAVYLISRKIIMSAIDSLIRKIKIIKQVVVINPTDA